MDLDEDRALSLLVERNQDGELDDLIAQVLAGEVRVGVLSCSSAGVEVVEQGIAKYEAARKGANSELVAALDARIADMQTLLDDVRRINVEPVVVVLPPEVA